jgi:hypothetical protein
MWGRCTKILVRGEEFGDDSLRLLAEEGLPSRRFVRASSHYGRAIEWPNFVESPRNDLKITNKI